MKMTPMKTMPLMRARFIRDCYEHDLREYWIDDADYGEFEKLVEVVTQQATGWFQLMKKFRRKFLDQEFVQYWVNACMWVRDLEREEYARALERGIQL